MSKHILRHRTSGFTTVSNNVIHTLKGDLECLGFYLYLLSLPDNWEFYKTEIMNTCNIGMKKLDTLLKKLSTHGLIVYGQKRDGKGQFSHFFIDIYDTESLKNNNIESYPQDETIIDSPVGNFCRTDSTAKRFQQPIKEVLQNKDFNKQNKDKSSCVKTQKAENQKRHDFADSMDKNANESRHIKEHGERKKLEMRNNKSIITTEPKCTVPFKPEFMPGDRLIPAKPETVSKHMSNIMSILGRNVTNGRRMDESATTRA